MADETVDAKGLNCPMPILRAKKALKGMAAGTTLEVQATDPGSVKDFEAFCRSTGNELLESRQDGNTYIYLIRKTG
jgi:tRNA 2-thiouridine synthesizing protein A